MTALYYLIFMPPLVVLAGVFWGFLGIVAVSSVESHLEWRKRKKLRAHRGRA